MRPTGLIYRLGRKPDPWAPPDWANAAPDGTFGNRFDDPEGIYRVIYASSKRLGCFLETLARFRPDPMLFAELDQIAGENDFYPLGQVPREWLRKRVMGSATAEGDYAEVCSSEWISRLRITLAARFREFGIEELDASVLQQSGPRRFTQLISRIAFKARFDGIYYRSKYGHDIENWAIFEPFPIKVRQAGPIRADDPDLLKALQLHQLRLQ